MVEDDIGADRRGHPEGAWVSRGRAGNLQQLHLTSLAHDQLSVRLVSEYGMMSVGRIECRIWEGALLKIYVSFRKTCWT
jgi:hypothetical protein